MSNKWYGWSKDDFDYRDANFTEVLYSKFDRDGQQIAESVDLRDRCPPIYYQGRMASCTANAIASALRFARMKELGHADEKFNPSRLYIYYNERMLANTSLTDDQKRTYDSGAQIRNGIKSFGRFGVCPENEWAYTDKPEAKPLELEPNATKEAIFVNKWPDDAPQCNPPQTFFSPADEERCKKYLGTELKYYRLGYDNEPDKSEAGIRKAAELKVGQLKRCLSAGYPFIFGFKTFHGKTSDDKVFNSMGEKNFDRSGAMKFVSDTKNLTTGGHAVLAVGYRDGHFIIRNSWGEEWGTGFNADGTKSGYNWTKKGDLMQGHFLMSDEWFLTPELTYDFWVVQAEATKEVDAIFL